MKYWLQPQCKEAFDYVRRLTACSSKSFYFSARLLPEERRWATFAVYGFCRYVDNIVDTPRRRSPDQLRSELAAIENELRIAYTSGESEHPVIQPFAIAASLFSIPQKYPLDLIRGVLMDLELKRYQSFDELYLFCYRVAAVVGLMMTHVFGYRDSKAFVYAEKLGIAMQLTNILRDIQEDKSMGRIYLPLSEMSQFGVTAKDIIEERMSPRLHALMEFQVERAHQYYQEAEPGIALLNPESQFAVYSASTIYSEILQKIKDRDYNPFLGRAFVSRSSKFATMAREYVRTKALRRRMPVKYFDEVNENDTGSSSSMG